MSLRSKIFAIMLLPFVVLVASTAALIVSGSRTSLTLAEERRASAVLDQLHSVQGDLTDMEDGMRGYVLTALPSFLDPYNAAVASLPHDLVDLRHSTTDDPTQAKRIDRLESLANVRIALLQEVRGFAPATSLTNRDQLTAELSQGEEVMGQIRATIGQIDIAEESRLARRQRGLDTVRRLSFIVGVVAMPIGLLLSLIVVWVITQGVVRRIRNVQENARRMEEGIVLDEPSGSDDEIGQLERALVRSGTRIIELQGELRRMGTLDQLTRLTNRRGFIPVAEHTLQQCRRTHEPVALMYADVDDLKTVNDTLGHAMGDAMIAEAGYVLRRTFRASDLVARMGGDEFCVMFSADSQAAADDALARLEAALAEVNAQEDRPFQLVFSTGLAMFDPEQPVSLDELLAQADERMYAQKRARGRERTGTAPIA